MNTTICPADYQVPGTLGMVPLIFTPGDFNDNVNNYLDTLHTDYAFIISTSPVVRSLDAPSATEGSGWDFVLYPNPGRDMLNLLLPEDDVPKDIALYDLAGKRVYSQNDVTDRLHGIPVEGFARGAYCVRVSSAGFSRMKTVILH